MVALTNTRDITPKEHISAQENSVPQVRILFMGTPELSAELLSFLITTGYNIIGVVTKKDKPVGREQTLITSAVKKVAEAHQIPVLTPGKITPEIIEEIKDLQPDLIIVAAYGKILPKEVLSIPGFGALNVHYSLLPRFRGASPIQHSLLFGDTETGVTLMKMDEGLDTGDIINTKTIAIDPVDTTQSLTLKLNKVSKDLLAETLPLWIKQKIQAKQQPEEGVVLCQLIERADGKIEWDSTATDIYNRYRAFTPWPGIFCFWKKKSSFVRLKLLDIDLSAKDPDTKHSLGEIFTEDNQTFVQTASGAIRLKEIQLEGKTRSKIEDFLNGNPDFIGSFLA